MARLGRHPSGGTTASFRSAAARRHIRREVYTRDHFTCRTCKWRPTEWQIALATATGRASIPGMTLDHIVPVSHGGRFENDNLQTLCEDCNRERGNPAPEEQL